jgi:hypothetical protein
MDATAVVCIVKCAKTCVGTLSWNFVDHIKRPAGTR